MAGERVAGDVFLNGTSGFRALGRARTETKERQREVLTGRQGGKSKHGFRPKRARPENPDGPLRSDKRISAARERRSLRRRAGFPRRHPRRHGCRHPRRCGWGSVRSRSVMEPGSCGSERNKFAAPSTNGWAADCTSVVADCKSAAANCRGCCRRTACCYRSAAAVRKSARC
jgi:hypothetical protein